MLSDKALKRIGWCALLAVGVGIYVYGLKKVKERQIQDTLDRVISAKEHMGEQVAAKEEYDDDDYDELNEELYYPASDTLGVMTALERQIQDTLDRLTIEDEEAEEADEEEEDNCMKRGLDPNSEEAWHQYREMLMSDIIDSDTLGVMTALFDHVYKPITDKDSIISEHIMEDRLEFFRDKDCCWVADVKPTMAEFFLHFAVLMDFDMGRGINHWLRVYFTNCDLYDAVDWSDMNFVCEHLCNHDYNGSFGWGLFALDKDNPAWMNPSFMQQYWNCSYLDMDDGYGDDDDD